MNLLIVNDEMIAAKGLMMGVEWNHYGIDEVDVAFESQSAKEKLQGNHYDILLCDIEMPGDNGIELVKWVREQKLDIEVIFLTCHADFEFAQEAIRLKSQNYILLPASYETVAQEISDVVNMIKDKKDAIREQRYGKIWLAEKSQDIAGNAGRQRTPKQSVEGACNYILKNLCNCELNLNMIAANLYLNADYLNRIFKKHMGTSIGHYILEQRMKLAADMLRESGHTATEIAEMVGYVSYTAFSIAFKNHYGCSPSMFKEKG